jgi:hypothetical protein
VIADPNKPGGGVLHPVIWLNTNKIRTTQTTTSITYEAAFVRPATGWFAFFIQLSFEGLENSVNQVTTETNIIPETYPFEDCYKESCYGKLV